MTAGPHGAAVAGVNDSVALVEQITFLVSVS